MGESIKTVNVRVSPLKSGNGKLCVNVINRTEQFSQIVLRVFRILHVPVARYMYLLNCHCGSCKILLIIKILKDPGYDF